MKTLSNRRNDRIRIATVVMASLFAATVTNAEDNDEKKTDQKSKSQLIDKESRKAIERALASKLPENIKEQILKALDNVETGDIEIDVEMNEAPEGTIKVETITIGKGMILGPDGDVSEFKWQGPGKKILDEMDPAIRKRILHVMKGGTNGKKPQSMYLKAGPVDVRTDAKIVVVDSDGKTETFAFGDDEDSPNLEEILPQIPKRLAEKMAAGRLNALLHRTENASDIKKEKNSDLNKKLDAILNRLTKIEAELETLKAK